MECLSVPIKEIYIENNLNLCNCELSNFNCYLNN